jgi:hypothetical protein
MGKRGFSKCLNPTAWVRALRCNTVYITCYRSMLLRSVDRSVRLGRLGVGPECKGECVSSTEEDMKAGTLQSMPTQEG